MLSSQRYRPSLQITLNDIFADFNDPRKQQIMKRVAIAMEMAEKRMKSEVEENNLNNLQLLVKKQQTLKNMEEKLQRCQQECEQLQQQKSYYSAKMTQLQQQTSKKLQNLTIIEEKLADSYHHNKQLQSNLRQMQKTLKIVQQQNFTLQQQTDVHDMEKEKYQVLIKQLKGKCQQKLEEADFLLRIKEKKMESSYDQKMQSWKIKIKNGVQKEKKEMQLSLAFQKKDKKNQKIQVNIQDTKRVSQRTITQLKDCEVQTDQIKEKENKQLKSQLVQTPSPKKQASKKLKITPRQQIKQQQINNEDQEISFTYPEIARCESMLVEQQQTQTDPINLNVQHNSPQIIFTQQQKQQLKQYFDSQLEILKKNMQDFQRFHNKKYEQIVNIYQSRPSLICDIEQIQKLKLQILQLKLKLQKKDVIMTKDRQLLMKLNQQNWQNQTPWLSTPYNQKSVFSRKQKFNKTCNILYSSPKKRVITCNSEVMQYGSSGWQDNLQQTLQLKPMRSRRIQDSQDDLITVLKGQQTLKYIISKKQSLKSTNLPQVMQGDGKIQRAYRKYSQLKKSHLKV